MADPSMNSSSNASTQLPAPLVLWAQRKDRLLLTIRLDDCKEPTCNLKSNSLYFKGKGGADETDHEVLIEFNKEVDPEASAFAKTGRGVTFKVMKKEETSSFWPRLLKDSKKVHWLKTDFDKWMDEDDSDVEADGAGGDHEDFNLEDMMQSMGGMQGGAGMPGMPGMPGADDGEDSDDEELPDLEGSS